MRFLSTAAVCLVGTAGLAQSPTPGMPSPGPMPMQGPTTTQSSLVRAFNAGPSGQIRSVYLANGSVVDLGSGFGPDLKSQIHKGTRIRVTGSRTEFNGQTIIVPQQLTIGQQSFTARPDPGPNGPRASMPQPPGSHDRARRGPNGDVARAGMPPPPPAGPGGPGMPPPQPAGVGAPRMPLPPLPPAGASGSVQPLPPPQGAGPVGPEQRRGSGPRNAPPPMPEAQRPAPGGSPQAPSLNSTQSAPSPQALPNM